MHLIEATSHVRRCAMFGIIFLGVGLIAGQLDLLAQRPESSFPHAKAGVTYDEFPHHLIGNWKPFPQNRDCGSLKDERGTPRGVCQYPVSQLVNIMNDRARAWINFFD